MSKVFIIAEAGVNHNGSTLLAKEMIDSASALGADAIKFQTFKTENVVSINAPKADYQKLRSDPVESQYEMIKKLELDEETHRQLITYSKDKKIQFLSSPFDLTSISLLSRLGLNTFKIPSGEITNLPYLREIGRLNKNIIMSSGLATLKEIDDALQILIDAGTAKKQITVLHCTSQYPTQYDDVNLKAMLTIQQSFNVKVGYSDHTPGIEVAVAAVALGASVIEKHFTLDRNMEGPDHQSSLEPDEFIKMVRSIRNIESALGDGHKRPTDSELNDIKTIRKSIVAKKMIHKGEVFSQDNLAVKRPGSGISPMCWDDVIGQKAVRDFKPDELIEL